MARNTFKLVGKLQMSNETEKFKPYKVTKSDKGWIGHRLSFQLKNITGYHNLELFEGYMENGSSLIYCIQKKEDFADEPVKLKIKWSDKDKQEIIDNVSEFNKMTVDLGEGNVSKYIAGYDFLQHIHNILKDEQFADKVFIVEGDVNYQSYNGKTYRKLNPKRISLAPQDVMEESTLRLELYYTEDCIDDIMYDDTKKYIINSYVAQYNSTLSENEYFLEPLVIDVSKAENEKQEKAFNIIKNRFIVNEEKVLKLGVKAVLVNGRERRQINLSDLTDEERDLIDCGLATLEEISAEYKNTINGDTVNEIKIVGFGYGYNKGSQDTDIEVSKLLGYTDTIIDGMFDDEIITDTDDLPFM